MRIRRKWATVCPETGTVIAINEGPSDVPTPEVDHEGYLQIDYEAGLVPVSFDLKNLTLLTKQDCEDEEDTDHNCPIRQGSVEKRKALSVGLALKSKK